MLNELPKKKKERDFSHPSRWQLFYRTQWECFRRSVTVYLMYLFMSLLALACQAIPNEIVSIVLGCICILGGAAFDFHLCYNFAKAHYDAFLTGELHRKNALFGIQSGGNHRPEREYRVWKGFLIGFYTGLPAIILGLVLGSLDATLGTPYMGPLWAYTGFALLMFAGWAIMPLTWFGGGSAEVGLGVSGFWAIFMALLPILVSGISYIIGAWVERRDRERTVAREKEIKEAAERASAEQAARADIRAEKRKLSKKK